jgi:hypothetical protein
MRLILDALLVVGKRLFDNPDDSGEMTKQTKINETDQNYYLV